MPACSFDAKVNAADLPGCGRRRVFFSCGGRPGVNILNDWDGFGMRSTETTTVRYRRRRRGIVGFPNFIEIVQPLSYWFALLRPFPSDAPLRSGASCRRPPPESPALRLRLSEARMREEAARAYLHETAREWRPGAGPVYASAALRTKTFVTQEATRLCAELFCVERRTPLQARRAAGADTRGIVRRTALRASVAARARHAGAAVFRGLT